VEACAAAISDATRRIGSTLGDIVDRTNNAVAAAADAAADDDDVVRDSDARAARDDAADDDDDDDDDDKAVDRVAELRAQLVGSMKVRFARALCRVHGNKSHLRRTILRSVVGEIALGNGRMATAIDVQWRSNIAAGERSGRSAAAAHGDAVAGTVAWLVSCLRASVRVDVPCLALYRVLVSYRIFVRSICRHTGGSSCRSATRRAVRATSRCPRPSSPASFPFPFRFFFFFFFFLRQICHSLTSVCRTGQTVLCYCTARTRSRAAIPRQSIVIANFSRCFYCD
jgi:hypothetical protein